MPVVELAFHAVSDWSITSTDLFFSIIDCSYESSGNILWTESLETDRKSLKGTNYVIARGMEWRFVDDPPSLNRV